MSFEKFCRPNSMRGLLFADPHAQQSIVDYVSYNARESLILEGPCGTGKSAIAQVILRNHSAGAIANSGTFEFENWLHGSSVTNMAVLENTLNTGLFSSDYVLIGIDEFDHLPKPVQQSLHAFWNKHSDCCGFVITTNNLHIVPTALRSRMETVRIECPSSAMLLPNAVQFLKSNGVNIPDQEILNLLDSAGADLRKKIRAIDRLCNKTKLPSV